MLFYMKMAILVEHHIPLTLKQRIMKDEYLVLDHHHSSTMAYTFYNLLATNTMVGIKY